MACEIIPTTQPVAQALPVFNTSLFERFIDYTDRSDATIKTYVTCIKHFVKWLDENEITQPERADVKEYRDYLKTSDLKTTTQAQYLRAVKHFFKWTASEGLYPNIADNIHGAKVGTGHKKDALRKEDVQKIADSIDKSDEQGKRLHVMFLLGVVYGLRTIEIRRANVEDLKKVGGETYLYLQGKGHDEKDAPVLLIPEVKDALQDYLDHREAKVTAKSPLFTSTSNRSKGQRISTTYISRALKEMLVNAGYDSDRLTAHSLRHTSGTGAIKAGIDLYGTQKLMRHCDPATTEIYIHEEENGKAEAKGRRAIYDYYFGEEESYSIIPDLEAELHTMTPEEQKELLAQIRRRKNG